MSNFCSVLCLCVAAVSCVLSIALMAISISTDNWQQVEVNRPVLKQFAEALNSSHVRTMLRGDMHYFDRIRGLFRVCFPFDEKPKRNWRELLNEDHLKASDESVDLYLNPLDEWCTNIDYYTDLLKIGEVSPKRLSSEGQIWLHFMRTCVACLCLFFFFVCLAAVFGLRGCWKVSGEHLISTATFLLIATLWGAAGMGFWHGALFYELNRVRDEMLGFYLSWPQVLRESTTFLIGWSYFVAWTSVAFSFLSCLCYTAAMFSIRNDIKQYKKQQILLKMQYCYPHHFHPQLHYRSMGPAPISMQVGALSTGYYSISYPPSDPRYPYPLETPHNMKDLIDSNL